MVVKETDLKGVPLIGRGKVRDIYDLGEHMLIVTTDRISAYDVIMNEPIPDKGKILTAISAFWFEMMADIIPNHLVSTSVEDLPDVLEEYAELLEGRIMIVNKAEPLPVECIVRGYITGSGWADYLKTGQVCGYELPENLRESEKLAAPLFTPSTKAELGRHDENITFDQAAELIGPELTEKVRDVSLAIYSRARDFAADKGIIIADTKFEFGILNGELIQIDEILTPDSSRFWPADSYQVGTSPPSFDKQYLRDWLSGLDWDKTPPPPALPQEVIEMTRAKYLEALERLSGRTIQ